MRNGASRSTWGARYGGDDRLEEVAHAGGRQLGAHCRRERAALGQVGLAVALLSAVLVDVVDDPAVEPRTIEHGEIELLVVRAEFDEQVEGLVEGADGSAFGRSALLTITMGANRAAVPA